jgi:Tol biopolymer transport system component
MNVRKILIFVSVFTCTALVASHSEAQTHKRQVTPEDLFSLREASDVRVSPTGISIAFALSSIDRVNNREVSNIWTIPTRGGPAEQVTVGAFNDSSPRWSPDGRYIAFSSNRTGNSDCGSWIQRQAKPGCWRPGLPGISSSRKLVTCSHGRPLGSR